MVPPKLSILIGCSIINHPFWGTPTLETPICCSFARHLFCFLCLLVFSTLFQRFAVCSSILLQGLVVAFANSSIDFKHSDHPRNQDHSKQHLMLMRSWTVKRGCRMSDIFRLKQMWPCEPFSGLKSINWGIESWTVTLFGEIGGVMMPWFFVLRWIMLRWTKRRALFAQWPLGADGVFGKCLGESQSYTKTVKYAAMVSTK